MKLTRGSTDLGGVNAKVHVVKLEVSDNRCYRGSCLSNVDIIDPFCIVSELPVKHCRITRVEIEMGVSDSVMEYAGF